jgi:multisubunit Na+/H+ antiporter MnhC subunit
MVLLESCLQHHWLLLSRGAWGGGGVYMMQDKLMQKVICGIQATQHTRMLVDAASAGECKDESPICQICGELALFKGPGTF